MQNLPRANKIIHREKGKVFYNILFTCFTNHHSTFVKLVCSGVAMNIRSVFKYSFHVRHHIQYELLINKLQLQRDRGPQ